MVQQEVSKKLYKQKVQVEVDEQSVKAAQKAINDLLLLFPNALHQKFIICSSTISKNIYDNGLATCYSQTTSPFGCVIYTFDISVQLFGVTSLWTKLFL